MLLRGPRRQVLWRLRFSVLAVVLGAPAILLIPQGQDILQRLAEGDNRPVRIGAGVLSLTWAALVVWYSASVLTQVRLPRDPPPSDVEWMDFFEYHIPRLLGIAVLGFGGAACARAASAFLRFSLVAILSYLLVLALAYRGGGAFLMALGRKFVSPSNHDNIQLTERFGRTVLAIVLGALIVWPRSLKRGGWWYDASSMDAYALKWAAWLSLIAAWALYLFVYYRRDLFSL